MKKVIIGVVAGVVVGGLLVFGVGSKMNMFGQKQETQVNETIVDTEGSEAVETKKAEDTEENKAAETKKTEKVTEVTPGNSVTDAYVMEYDEKVSGTIELRSSAWFAFNTEEAEDVNYHIVLINEAPDSTEIYFTIVDEFGDELESDFADSDGTPSTITKDELEANTTYYIHLHTGTWGTDADYTLTVKTSDAK